MTLFPPDAKGVVVLGGAQCTQASIRGKLARAEERKQGNVVSVQIETWDTAESRESVVLRASEGLPYGKVMVASSTELIAAGFSLKLEVDNDEAPNHYHVEFGSDISDAAIDRFIGCFGEPEANPAKGKK
ncbi:hypothetical protein ACH49M_21540 [Rhodococcus qingshengii]|uniref:hypothetical protein n=1 Tax=Rhodococcus erythropolis group TaxID=2840174 RepID=UPI002227C6B9|nr:hypothetical protein [Rhodococcus erythropolis]MCW2300680.1 hypothetical protein [Rhodococcus erythropolis]